MTDAEINALAEETLSRAVTFIRTIEGACVISEVGEFTQGHVGPIYEGISPYGDGRFLFAFDPRDAVKKIIIECERLSDELEFELTDAKTGKPITSRHAAKQTPESRERSLKTIAEFAVTHLIGMFGFRMRDVLREAVEDSFIIAKTSLAAVPAAYLTEKGVINTPADVRPLIEEAAKRAADRKREDLLGHINGVPHLLAQRGRGAPIKSDFQRKAARTKFVADIKEAYCDLRAGTKKRPTRTDVARALGVGGDPKRGGQSAIQVFSKKLKALDINGDTITAAFDAELDK